MDGGHRHCPCGSCARDRHQAPSKRGRARHRGRAVDERGACIRGASCRERCRTDVCRGAISRELGSPSRSARDDRASRTRAPECDPLCRRHPAERCDRQGRAGRPAACAAGRRRPRGRHCRVRGGASRPVGADGRVGARSPREGRHGDERFDKQRRCFRPGNYARRRRQHLCAHRPLSRGRPTSQGADVAPG